MITIRTLAAPELWCLQPQGYSEQFHAPGQSLTQYRRMFGFMLTTPYSDSEPLFTEEEVPMGLLDYPSDQRWGQLRDRDVFHIHGAGSIDLTRVALSFVPNENHYEGYLDPFIDFAGYGRFYASRTAYWGVDESYVSTYDVGVVNNVDKGYASPTIHVKHGVHFDGDLAFVYQYKQPYDIEWSSAPMESIAGDCRAYVYKRYRTNGNVSIWYHTFLTTEAYKIVNPYTGLAVAYDSIDGELEQWYRETLAVQWTCRPLTATGVTEGYVAGLRNEIVERLQGPSLIETMAYVFTTYPVPFDIGYLGHDILSQLRFVDANLLITAFELATLRIDPSKWKQASTMMRSVQAALKTGKKTSAFLLRDFKRILKQGSGRFLGLEYGVLPTLRDWSAVVDGMSRLLNEVQRRRRYHARHQAIVEAFPGSAVESTFTMTVEASTLPRDFPGMAMRGVGGLRNFGIWPDLEAVWDFIPFSFVADWFLHIQPAVEAMDDVIWVQYFPIDHVIISEKLSWSVPLDVLWPDIGVSSIVELISYRRYCSRELPLPPIKCGDADGPFKNWAEATALVLAKIK